MQQSTRSFLKKLVIEINSYNSIAYNAKFRLQRIKNRFVTNKFTLLIVIFILIFICKIK